MSEYSLVKSYTQIMGNNGGTIFSADMVMIMYSPGVYHSHCEI